MAIALGGRPDERAKMVWSFECIVLFASAAPATATPIDTDDEYDRRSLREK
jgi:hypothetical protein